VSNGNQMNKSLSVGHLVATAGLIVGGFAFIYDLRESVAIQEFQLVSLENRVGRIVERTDDQFGEIMRRFNILEEKLDELVLSSHNNK
tara:strand:- start:426 stop:689 length:264 start_codon:yes stop_codon:yes gene_type:complete